MKWGKTNGIDLVVFPKRYIYYWKYHLVLVLKTVQTMQNHNQTWIFIIFYLVSNDVGVGCKQLVEHNSVISFCTPSCSTALCKGSVFLQFCDKIQSSMHQIFTQMYLTFSIGQSHMERPTESIIKKFFFRFDGHPIFLHLFEPTSQQKSPKPGAYYFTILPPFSKTSPEGTWT